MPAGRRRKSSTFLMGRLLWFKGVKSQEANPYEAPVVKSKSLRRRD